EHRYFTPGNKAKSITWKDHKIALLICEDMWQDDIPDQLYQQNIDLIISIHASPFTIEKDKDRKTIAKDLCLTHKLDLVYANQIGGQDELVFDGGSFICNKKGNITSQLAYFKEEWNNQNSSLPPQTTSIYQALMLSLSDYTSKNGFDKVLLGLSGGIDSALTAAIAVDALGADKVVAVMLPSQYTSELSIIDAKSLAQELNIELLNIPIEDSTKAIKSSLSHITELETGSVTDQNIQARMRGLMLMSLSNQFGYLLLSTGNKSENAVGYATLYGDMCGGFNILKDLYKTQVYELSKYRALPKSIIEKAPSAELHHNQKDQDSLPDYDLLDKILFSLIEENLSIEDIKYDKEIVRKIYNLLKKSEYKRRQSCPGVIISTRALTNDWRYPMTNGL
ncbi:MAG: NAD+ synthase, partial [Francisellaceae bacterium]|nr:NAD+ synthase [Francisellaceae bacterium]